MNEKLLSLNELLKSHEIYWIKSFPTLRKWVKRDLEENNYLDTKVIKNSGTGIRYYIPQKNIEVFVKAFENQTLYGKQEESNT